MRTFFKILFGILLGGALSVSAATILFPTGGGTGVGTLPTNKLIVGNGVGPVYSAGTTTASCSGSAACTAFTILGTSPVTITASGGGGSGTVGTSTNETQGFLPYWTTTSGTPALLGKVATGTETCSTGASCSAFTIVGTGGAITVSGLTTSNFSSANISQWTNNSNYITLGSLSATTPIIYNAGAFTWVGLATTSQPSSSNVLTSNGGAGVYGTATSTLTPSSPLTGSFTQLGSGGTLGLTTSGTWTGNAGTATALATGRTISITGDLAYTSPSFDGSGNITAAGTLATVNGNVGTFTYPSVTVNGKGLITAIANGSAPTTYTGTYPVIVTGSVISSGFGTTTDSGIARNMVLTTNATGVIVASSTPTVAAIHATSTTAFSYFMSSVGIGTSSPEGQFTVQSVRTGNDAPALIVDGSGTLNGNGDIELEADGSGTTGEANIDFARAGTNYWQLGIQNNGTNANDFELWDNSDSPIFTVKASGSNQGAFGFATTSPFGDFAIDADYGDVFGGNLIFNIASSSLTGTTTVFSVDNTGAASTTKLFGSFLSPCTSTNALTWSAGAFGCTAIPQGTVTAIGVTTNQGVSGSSSGGATPNLTLTLGALTGVTSYNGLVVTANTGVITTGTWQGTTIAEANGGTGATSIGANMLTANNGSSVVVSTSTPTAAAYLATTTTATSSFQGAFLVGTTTEPTAAAGEFMQIISNAARSIGGLAINTWTNVTNAFTIQNAAGTTVLNVDDTSANAFWGVATSSPWATLSAVGDGTDPIFALASSTAAASSKPRFEIDAKGHTVVSGPVPALSSCGTSAFTGAANDQAGEIGLAGTALTACTMTFAQSYTNAPVCTVSDNSATSVADITSISNTTIIFGLSAGITTANLWYQCQSTQ